MTRKLCLIRYSDTDPHIEALPACKLIPLNKNPGVRPIGDGKFSDR